MRIDELKLKNFRCFEERTFKFHPQFNCITGKNASGKTAILEALTAPMREWINTLAIPNEKWQRIQTKDVSIQSFSSNNPDGFIYKYPCSVEASGGFLGREFISESHLSTYDESAMRFIDDKDHLARFARSFRQEIQIGSEYPCPLLTYYQTTRLYQIPDRDGKPPIDTLTSSDLVRMNGYQGCLDATISLRRIRSWMDRQARIESEEGEETKISRVVRGAMAQILEDVQDIRFRSRYVDLVITFNNGSQRVFNQLSDGQRNLLALAGDIAMRMARLNPHLGEKVLEETPGIVLIDELDLHLHPEWQRSVVDNLKKTFPKIQFFVTTHSPFIIQSLGEWEHLPLEGQPVENPQRYGIEDIAEGLMGVKHPQVGKKYLEMLDNAKDYLAILEEAESSPEEKQEEYKRLLAERLVPYADNPAYQAFLEAERLGRLGP